jgi:hypothetical protein
MTFLTKHLPFLSLSLCLLSGGCVVYPELVERGVHAPKSERCGDCHRDIYNEWKDSPHARSFISGTFREETNEYRFTFCTGCHAPETIFTDKKIESRKVNLDEGVHCNSCHLNDCKLSGPAPAHGPHPIDEKNPFYRTSDLCGKCHVSTFKTWQASDNTPAKKTCQDCHMPAIKRKLIQDEPWQKLYPQREGRQHTFSFQAMHSKSIDSLPVSFKNIVHTEGRIEGILEVENTDIPHTIPTGDYGYREVVITIEMQDKTGQTKHSQSERLFVETGTALQYKEKRGIPFCFRWDEESYALKASVTRVFFNRKENIPLAETTYKP